MGSFSGCVRSHYPNAALSRPLHTSLTDHDVYDLERFPIRLNRCGDLSIVIPDAPDLIRGSRSGTHLSRNLRLQVLGTMGPGLYGAFCQEGSNAASPLLISFFVRREDRFFVPTCPGSMTPRADAVKDGRRCEVPQLRPRQATP